MGSTLINAYPRVNANAMTYNPSTKHMLLTLLLVIFAAFAQNVNGKSSYDTKIVNSGDTSPDLSVRQLMSDDIASDDIAVEGLTGQH